MLEKLLADKGTPLLLKANKLFIPVHVCDNTAAGAHEFNQYYTEMLAKKNWNSIVRTPSGGVSIARKNFKPPMWDLKYNNACIELTILGTRMLRIQFRQASSVKESEGTQIYGRQAFREFKRLLFINGIDLDKMTIDNGAEVKQEIPKYLIKFDSPIWQDKMLKHCHHVDFHNSFPAGLANTHPEFRSVVDYLYKTRKNKPINKAILNYSIGFMQSLSGCGARWAHLSRDAIMDNNKRVEELATRLKKAGRGVISYNTDGIWYCGEIYHGEGEGPNLGQWENDHIDCVFRAKSAGAYEFIEDGVYTPVIRGRTNLDLIKPRTEWEWGDIYAKAAAVIQFYWIDGKGIVDADDNLM